MERRWIVRKRFMLVLSVLVGIPLVAYGAWTFHQESQDRAFAQAVLLKDVAEMGTFANVLRLLEEGRDDKAKEVLEFWMASSAESGRDLVRSGARLDSIGINLLEGVRLTKGYAEKHDLVRVVDHTTEVLQALEEQP